MTYRSKSKRSFEREREKREPCIVRGAKQADFRSDGKTPPTNCTAVLLVNKLTTEPEQGAKP
jgi:hypothetical protein